MNTKKDLSGDLTAINQISIVPQLLEVICRTTKLRFAAIARVTDERWLACATLDNIPLGLKAGDELDIKDTFCDQVHKTGKPVIFNNVHTDTTYSDHHIPPLFGIESYISVPIYKKNGEFFGTLCALDSVPANIDTTEVKDMFKLFTDLISFHLETVEKMEATSKTLKEEREMADLRDQFIAILGHDLKNPIATMRMSSDILLKMSKEEITLKHAAMIKSTSFRMQNLIENILDFAKGKMGEGIVLDQASNNGSLVNILEQVIKEINISSPERKIDLKIDLKSDVYCDKNRIGQLLANLLSNADQHGDRDAPLKVFAHTTDDHFELTVTNKGEKIPEEAIDHLFQPFYRDKNEVSKKGLGLGLFIAAEIAKAHKGKLLVTSTAEDTSFTLRMPLKERS
ncbi:sensor histidine kinase [Salinimicrobium sp. CAU 1759]